MNWTYSSALKQFKTTLEVGGTVQMTRFVTASTLITSTMSPTVNGTLNLWSKVYPGPGFSGNYNWTGNLLMTPDPFAEWGITPANVSAANARRRDLLSGFQQEQDAATTTAETARTQADSSSQSYGSTSSSSAASGGSMRNCSMTSSSSQGKSVLADNTSAQLPVTGRVSVAEINPLLSGSGSAIILADQTIIVAGRYVPDTGVDQYCWGTVACPVKPVSSGSLSAGISLPAPAAPTAEHVCLPSWLRTFGPVYGPICGGIMIGGLAACCVAVCRRRRRNKKREQYQMQDKQHNQQLDSRAFIREVSESGRVIGQVADVDGSSLLHFNGEDYKQHQQQEQQDSKADEQLSNSKPRLGKQTLSASNRSSSKKQAPKAAAAATAARRNAGMEVSTGSMPFFLQLPGSSWHGSTDDQLQWAGQQQQQQNGMLRATELESEQAWYQPLDSSRRQLTSAAASAVAVEAGNRLAAVPVRWSVQSAGEVLLSGGGALSLTGAYVHPARMVPSAAGGAQAMTTAALALSSSGDRPMVAAVAAPGSAAAEVAAAATVGELPSSQVGLLQSRLLNNRLLRLFTSSDPGQNGARVSPIVEQDEQQVLHQLQQQQQRQLQQGTGSTVGGSAAGATSRATGMDRRSSTHRRLRVRSPAGQEGFAP
eukprot:GHRR01019647.1.p1 GENE.GHRR01019647.1~~GHRR01019647.1.p1  ORF type:complete len:652 (+),score=259.44 GHRR01019647.1:1236-3191(+)